MSSLCKVCSTVFVNGSVDLHGPDLPNPNECGWSPFHPSVVTKVKWHPLHKSRRIYEEGLAYGCELCSFVTSIVPRGSRNLQTSFVFLGDGDEIELIQAFHILNSSDAQRLPSTRNALSFSINSVPGSSHIKEIHDLAIAANKSSHTGSKEALHLASFWLAECSTRHERCSRLLRPIWYPTRLLEITGRLVKLIVTAERDLRGPYLTLSHRWGAVEPKLMLTPDTADTQRNGLDIASLEPTFRDALNTTRSFGIQYLWIDLFCIFQGQDDESKQDWIRESVTMDRVYAGSFLNISAARSHDGTAGCFKKRSASARRASIVPFWAKYRGDDSSFHEVTPDWSSDDQNDFFSNSPIFSRGWIVQERILAPRVLHFSDYGMVWECSEGVVTQSRPHMLDWIRPESPSPLPGALEFSGNSRADLVYIWNCAFQSYSRSTLTMPNQDKLIALQGISKRVAELLQDTLYFGFLSCRMPYSLCWVVDYYGLRRPGIENESFPSWHFARSNDRLHQHDDPYGASKVTRRYERPLLCYFHSPDLDPTSSVVPRYLCCVAKIIILVADSSDFLQSQQIRLNLAEITENADGNVRIVSRNKERSTLTSFHVNFDHAWNSQYDRRMLTLMPVYTSGHPMPGDAKDRRACSGLVLQQITDGGFVRKGTFTCYKHFSVDPYDFSLDLLLKALSKARPKLVMIA